jgi:predicted nucleic acid-binding Zn ribbon protein
MEVKRCLECNEPLRGRTDKKYCSDACRNSYNNKQNKQSYNLVRQTNRILAKNLKILIELNTSGKTTLPKTDLLNKGFNFKFFTSTYQTNSGKLYYFCYDQGYLELENNKYLLVKKER